MPESGHDEFPVPLQAILAACEQRADRNARMEPCLGSVLAAPTTPADPGSAALWEDVT